MDRSSLKYYSKSINKVDLNLLILVFFVAAEIQKKILFVLLKSKVNFL